MLPGALNVGALSGMLSILHQTRMLFQPLKHVSPVGGTALRNRATSSRLVAEAAGFGRCDHDSAAAQEPAHNSAVLLLNPGLIVLAPWRGASEFDPMAEAILDERLVHKLTAVISSFQSANVRTGTRRRAAGIARRAFFKRVALRGTRTSRSMVEALVVLREGRSDGGQRSIRRRLLLGFSGRCRACAVSKVLTFRTGSAVIPKYRFKFFRERLELACPSNLGRDKTELYVYLPSYSGSYPWEKSQPSVLYVSRASS